MTTYTKSLFTELKPVCPSMENICVQAGLEPSRKRHNSGSGSGSGSGVNPVHNPLILIFTKHI